MKRIVLAAALMAAGCGSEPEDRSRLAAGRAVVLYDRQEDSVVAKGPTCGGERKDFAYFTVGTRASVIEDAGPDFSDPTRMVRVSVESGPACAAQLARENLRPAK